MDNDADLARAISLSLQDVKSQPPRARSASITISDDSIQEIPAPAMLDPDARFEADLARALKLSQEEGNSSIKPSSSSAGPAEPAPPPPATTAASASVAPESHATTAAGPPVAAPAGGFLSERAQMEQARLERLARLRPDLGRASSSTASTSALANRKRSRDTSSSSSDEEDEESTESSSKRQRATTAGPGENGKGKHKEEEQYFYDAPSLRQTANALVDPAKDTKPVWRLSEIIGQKSELTFALISSYAIDWGWIYEFFDRATPVVCVSQPDESGNTSLKEVLPGWIKTTPFLRAGRGCQHMKFMLLFYKSGRLRVVINTANFVPYDWRDIENTSWVQDIHPRASPIPPTNPRQPTAPGVEEDFGQQFERVLRAVHVEPALQTLHLNGREDLPLTTIADLRSKWDFGNVKAKLVASLAGKHEGWPAVIRTGHPSLMKAVRELNARCGPDRRLKVEYQGSSIGTYSTQWVNEFYDSCRGESAEAWLDRKTARTKLPFPEDVHIIFPSVRTVRESKLGEAGGSTMFCRANQWDGAKFPRHLFRDSKSKRGGVLMHSKMIVATFSPSTSRPGQSQARGKKNVHDSDTEESDEIEEVGPHPARSVQGWCYVGSHNFTPSAWGTLSGSAFNPILNITNYEIGVVFPLESAAVADMVACWERPPRKYDLPQERAWIQDESNILRDMQAAS